VIIWCFIFPVNEIFRLFWWSLCTLHGYDLWFPPTWIFLQAWTTHHWSMGYFLVVVTLLLPTLLYDCHMLPYRIKAILYYRMKFIIDSHYYEMHLSFWFLCIWLYSKWLAGIRTIYLEVTSEKLWQKCKYRHTGYMGIWVTEVIWQRHEIAYKRKYCELMVIISVPFFSLIKFISMLPWQMLLCNMNYRAAILKKTGIMVV
jgi:hypothetical protein